MKTVPRILQAALIVPLLITTATIPWASAQEAAKAPPKEAPATAGGPPAIKYDPTPLPQGTPSYAPVVEKVSPSVVTISTSKNVRPGAGPMGNNPLFNDPTFRKFFGIPDNNDDDDQGQNAQPNQRKNGRGPARKQALGLGSGVIVSPEGHIITNNHVVEGADDIIVTIGNNTREYKAKKVGTDPGTDIAVLKIDAQNLPAITFADSDKMRAGDIVIAVGNPFGLTRSVTMGIISSIGRGGMGIIDYENFIQTDASINPGNSGGALVDYQGRLIGVNTAIFSRSGGNQGIGFAVPANLARSVMESILKTGRVTRGFLGVSLQPLTDELANALNIKGATQGALIAEVQAGSPSEKAGIQNGDVVTAVGDKKVDDPRELQLMIGSMAPGTKVDLKVMRDGQEKTVQVELGERPGAKGTAQAESNEGEPDVLDGVTVSDIEPQIRKELELPENIKGVVITQIDPDSPSATAGLKRGDVIQEINREAVTTAKQAVELSEKLKKEKKVVLRVSSRGTSRYVVVERK
ncbi:DegQ family serine endoprotease [Verrucomicrobiota bacterium sgz303538]